MSADAMSAKARWGGRLAALRGAVERASDDPAPWLALADFLLAIGAPKAAAQSYEAAAQLDPARPEAHLGLSHALCAAGRFRQAETAARAALAIAASGAAWKALGAALYGLRRYAAALAAFDEAVALTPDAAAPMHRAMTLCRLGRSAEAIGVYHALASRDGAAPDLYCKWAAAERNAGAPARAETALELGLAKFPYDERMHQALAELRWSRGEGAGSFARAAEAALAANPAQGALRLSCAYLLERAGRRAAAEAMLREGLALAPDDVRLMVQLGSLLDLGGRVEDAEHVLSKAMQLAPESVQVRTKLAHARLRLGEAGAAQALLAPLRAQVPEDQLVIAYEALAARLNDDPLYRALFDYERLVRAIDFPTPAGYGSIDAFNEALGRSLDALHRDTQRPVNQSLTGGTQSADLLDSSDPVILAFFNAAIAVVRDYVSALPRDDGHPFLRRRAEDIAIQDAWSVRLRAGDGHSNHIHPLAWISSAYYVRVPLESAPPAGWLKFGEPLAPIEGCAPAHWIAPQAGRLVLFPSYMWHGVAPFHNAGERMTISFDVIPL